MQTALRTETTVLPGHRLEISAPELPEGARVEVIVLWPEKPAARFASALEFLEFLPPGPRAFKAWEEYEQHLAPTSHRFQRMNIVPYYGTPPHP